VNNENLLRTILGANTDEPTVDAARRIVDELIAWRGGCEAAFGITTADPRSTLVVYVKAQQEHHREHHTREREAWLLVAKVAGYYSPEHIAAEDALEALDEQGMP
jgi:hypothetical protein